jgi:hypothetical protein
MQLQMTIREIRKWLFETDKYAVIGMDEMSNQEARNFLYKIPNQLQKFNVIDNKTHLLIWS